MCLEDLKLGRGRVKDKSVSTSSSTSSLLPADARRVAILVTWTGLYGFDPAGPSVTADTLNIYFGPTAVGVPDFSYSGPGLAILLRIEDLGQAITGPISVNIASVFGVASVTMQPIYTEVNAQPAMRDYKP